MRGVVELMFEKNSLSKFNAVCQAAIRNISNGTKYATEAAAKEILENSKQQVPVDTGTLLSSAFYEVSKRIDVKSYVYEAVLGYGGNGNPVNPRTGHSASSYMVVVHEDLGAVHMVGKAKFLEDPIRDYAAQNFERTVFTYARDSLTGMAD